MKTKLFVPGLYGLLLLLLGMSIPAIAAPQNISVKKDFIIVIRRVIIPSSADTQQNVEVNLVIKNGELDLISEDEIPLEDVDATYDASGGIVIGQFDLGQPASFIILREDPRINIQALLDTKKHASFAIFRGKILKNAYATVLVTEEKRKKQSKGWLAYTPPPLVRQSSYTDETKWNKFNTRAVNGIVAGALLLDRQRWVNQDSRSLTQLGVDLETFSGGEIRALRIGAVGTFNFQKPWVWTVFGATHAFDKGFDQTTSDDFSWLDVRVDIPVFEKMNVSIGKQKEPISMERIMSLINTPMQERTIGADALLPSRNVGIVASGYVLNDRVSFAGGIFNNFLDKDQPNSMSNNASQLVARATWVPFMSENESTLLHLGLGYRYSDIKEGGSFRATPEFNKSPDFFETDFISANETDKAEWYQFEASLRSGPFWLHGEFIQANIESGPLDDPTLEGYNVMASWIATGEVRPYRKRNGTFGGVPIARTVKQNGLGALEYALRYSSLQQTEGNLIEDRHLDVWSVGINWWLTPLFNVNLNYRYIRLDEEGILGHSSGINSRITLVLE